MIEAFHGAQFLPMSGVGSLAWADAVCDEISSINPASGDAKARLQRVIRQLQEAYKGVMQLQNASEADQRQNGLAEKVEALDRVHSHVKQLQESLSSQRRSAAAAAAPAPAPRPRRMQMPMRSVGQIMKELTELQATFAMLTSDLADPRSESEALQMQQRLLMMKGKLEQLEAELMATESSDPELRRLQALQARQLESEKRVSDLEAERAELEAERERLLSLQRGMAGLRGAAPSAAVTDEEKSDPRGRQERLSVLLAEMRKRYYVVIDKMAVAGTNKGPVEREEERMQQQELLELGRRMQQVQDELDRLADEEEDADAAAGGGDDDDDEETEVADDAFDYAETASGSTLLTLDDGSRAAKAARAHLANGRGRGGPEVDEEEDMDGALHDTVEQLEDAYELATRYCKGLASDGEKRRFLQEFFQHFRSPLQNDPTAMHLLIESIVVKTSVKGGGGGGGGSSGSSLPNGGGAGEPLRPNVRPPPQQLDEDEATENDEAAMAASTTRTGSVGRGLEEDDDLLEEDGAGGGGGAGAGAGGKKEEVMVSRILHSYLDDCIGRGDHAIDFLLLLFRELKHIPIEDPYLRLPCLQFFEQVRLQHGSGGGGANSKRRGRAGKAWLEDEEDATTDSLNREGVYDEPEDDEDEEGGDRGQGYGNVDMLGQSGKTVIRMGTDDDDDTDGMNGDAGLDGDETMEDDTTFVDDEADLDTINELGRLDRTMDSDLRLEERIVPAAMHVEGHTDPHGNYDYAESAAGTCVTVASLEDRDDVLMQLGMEQQAWARGRTSGFDYAEIPEGTVKTVDTAAYNSKANTARVSGGRRSGGGGAGRHLPTLHEGAQQYGAASPAKKRAPRRRPVSARGYRREDPRTRRPAPKASSARHKRSAAMRRQLRQDYEEMRRSATDESEEQFLEQINQSKHPGVDDRIPNRRRFD